MKGKMTCFDWSLKNNSKEMGKWTLWQGKRERIDSTSLVAAWGREFTY